MAIRPVIVAVTAAEAVSMPCRHGGVSHSTSGITIGCTARLRRRRNGARISLCPLHLAFVAIPSGSVHVGRFGSVVGSDASVAFAAAALLGMLPFAITRRCSRCRARTGGAAWRRGGGGRPVPVGITAAVTAVRHVAVQRPLLR